MVYARFAPDDAYITYRYARNIANGLGFVYNPGEWVLGTTTPLYTLLLALGIVVTRLDAATLSIIFAGASLWLSAGILYTLGKDTQPQVAFVSALMFILNPFQRYFIGMESFLLNALVLLTIWSYQRERRGISALLGGLAVLTRYEAILLLVLIAGFDLFKRRRLPFWMLLAGLPVGVWTGYAWRVFGTPIPLSATVKLAAPRIPFLTGYLTFWFQDVIQNPWLLIVIVFVLLGVMALVVARRLPTSYGLVLAWGTIYLAAAAIYAGSFPWYYAPFTPALAVLISLGVHFIGNLLHTIERLSEMTRQRARIVVISIGTLLLVLAQGENWVQHAQRFGNQPADPRFFVYSEASHWLLKNAKPIETLSAYEIGYLGYQSNIVIIDVSGLVT